MRRDQGALLFTGLLLAFLIGLAAFLPENPLTGNVVKETCEDGQCLELCDMGADACGRDLDCCFTHWDSGVCAPAQQCESIREASLYSSLEVYQDNVRDAPPLIDPGQLVWPLVLIGALVGYVVLRRHDPLW